MNPNKGRTYKDLLESIYYFCCLFLPTKNPSIFILILSVYAIIAILLPYRYHLLPISPTRSIILVFSMAYVTASFLEGVSGFAKILTHILLHKLLHKSRQSKTFFSGNFFNYKLSNQNPEGYIYLIVRKKDGIYKIGRTKDFNKRFKQLRKEQGEIYPVALWECNEMTNLEKVALEMTKEFSYIENGQKELRAMTDSQVMRFIVDLSDFIDSQSQSPRVKKI